MPLTFPPTLSNVAFNDSMIPFLEYLWAFVERFLGLLRSNTNSKGPFPPTRFLRDEDVAPAIEMQPAGVRSQPDIEKLESEVKRLRDDVKLLTEEVERRTAACASLQRKLEAQDILLQTRQAELREAQAYSGTVDRLSDMDVLRTLDALNAEILQAAAHIVDELQFQDVAPTVAARDDAKEIVGAAVVKMLFAVGKERCSEYVVQLALQAAYVQFARGVVESWSATSTQHAALKEAHEGIFLAGTSILLTSVFIHLSNIEYRDSIGVGEVEDPHAVLYKAPAIRRRRPRAPSYRNNVPRSRDRWRTLGCNL